MRITSPGQLRYVAESGEEASGMNTNQGSRYLFGDHSYRSEFYG
ncbi:hypothetical protein [Streptomyces cadmiisoli]|nr:hypothetical protein [Streptomyces cadmiisoli]